jgi:DNA-binding NarL/FixJ family response regulator
MMRILILDDNVSFRRSLAEHLLQYFPHLQILEAENAEEAREKLTSFTPHLLIVDIQLPGESGLGLTRSIKACHPETVVAILTGHDLPEFREAACRMGADYFFGKSESLEPVVTLIESFERG